jgi:hypothetical protein
METEFPRTLSSAQTFMMKVILPVFWIGVFGAGMLILWLGAMQRSAGAGASSGMRWPVLMMWIAGTAFIVWSCARLKRVRIDREFLYVSNYRREIVVPLSAIEAVTENRWINIHPVTVRFRVPTEFGQSITFMPTARFWGWSSHPVVQELRDAAHL